MRNFITALFILMSGGSAYAAIIPTANYPSVQAAISAAQHGDTVLFTAGHDYGSVPGISLRSGLIYDGNGAKLSGNPVFPFNALSDIEIKNFTLSGSGMSGVSLKNAKIHDNVFNLGSNGTGIYVWVSAPADNCKINPAQCNAAMPVTASNVVIERNDFYGTTNYTGQNEGIHVRFDTPAPPGPDNGPGKSSGFVFRNNRMRNISRCGGEFQGGSTGSIFEDNVFISPSFSTNQSVNSGSMGLSLAMDASHGTIARRNKIDGAPSRTIDGIGVRNGIEGSGHGYLATDNWIHNCNNGGDINNGNDNPSIVDNNMGGNASDAVATQMGTRPFHISNNGLSVSLSWDINRNWPINIPSPPLCAQDSLNDTFGTSLCLSGHQYGISSGHISIDSKSDLATSGIISLLLHGGKVYQKAASWWVSSVSPPAIGSQWLMSSDPRPPACVPNTCPAGCTSTIVCQ